MGDSVAYMSEKVGMPPGALVHVGQRKRESVKITALDYSPDLFKEELFAKVEDALPFFTNNRNTWLNVDGLHDIETIQKLGEHLELHHLLLEDILNTNHRPKSEDLTEHVFFTLKMIGVNSESTGIVKEQVSLVLGDDWLLSFQEEEGDVLENLRDRLRHNKGVIRQRSIDFVWYRIIDSIVDNYFLVTEFFGEEIEKIEKQIVDDFKHESFQDIQRLKREIVAFRRAVSPLREAISSLLKDNSKLISDLTMRHLRDVYEHVIQVNEGIEMQRDLLSSVTDLYNSALSNRMNQVMQTLTIIATIFIPLTFVAGIYGMNFDSMPELHWKYGYPAAWSVMLILTIVMIVYFKRKKWF